MRTPEAIKNGLGYCRGLYICNIRCEYYPEKECEPMLLDDAKAYIEQLERERDQLLEDIHGECSVCAFYDWGVNENPFEPCMNCHMPDFNYFKWRGISNKEGTHENP